LSQKKESHRRFVAEEGDLGYRRALQKGEKLPLGYLCNSGDVDHKATFPVQGGKFGGRVRMKEIPKGTRSENFSHTTQQREEGKNHTFSEGMPRDLGGGIRRKKPSLRPEGAPRERGLMHRRSSWGVTVPAERLF